MVSQLLSKVEALHSEGLSTDAEESASGGEGSDEETAPNGNGDADRDQGIITTADEVEAFELVQTIVADVVPPERVVIKDTQNYCGVLLDNNVRRPICRFYLEREKYRLRLINEDKTETRVELAVIEDIAQHVDILKATIARYSEG